jgi:hypothetical protein
MFAAMHQSQFNCTAKQAGFMPTYWLAVDSLINREGTRLGSREGDGYA